MTYLDALLRHPLFIYFSFLLILPCLIWLFFRLVKWGRGMSKGAFLFLAIFPLLSIFPIPPPVFKNIEKAKQEQRKRKEDSGDPPDDSLEPEVEPIDD